LILRFDLRIGNFAITCSLREQVTKLDEAIRHVEYQWIASGYRPRNDKTHFLHVIARTKSEAIHNP